LLQQTRQYETTARTTAWYIRVHPLLVHDDYIPANQLCDNSWGNSCKFMQVNNDCKPKNMKQQQELLLCV
jgi:hypothetical protein